MFQGFHLHFEIIMVLLYTIFDHNAIKTDILTKIYFGCIIVITTFDGLEHIL